MTVWLAVYDRDTGEPMLLRSECMARELFMPGSFAIAIQFLRDYVRDLLLHELDECILVEGVRLYDPHKPKPPAKYAGMVMLPPNVVTP